MTTALQRYAIKVAAETEPAESQRYHRYRPRKRRSINDSLIQSRPKYFSVSFEVPNLTPRILEKEEEILNNVYKQRRIVSKHKYQLKPLKRPEPVRLLNPSFSTKLTSLMMPSSRTKITDQYQNQLQDMKLVERLLSVRPSKDVSKTEQQLFYKEHVKNMANIQTKKNRSLKTVRSKKKPQWNHN